MRVRVYFNLHLRQWSIQGYTRGKGWRIVAHAHELWLRDVTFKVSEKGRQRVIREQRKNVHAYAIGTLVATISARAKDGSEWDAYAWNGTGWPNCHFRIWSPVRYNPYEGDSFTIDGEPVDSVKEALFEVGPKLHGTHLTSDDHRV